jgi:Tol biopolymer transport system component
VKQVWSGLSLAPGSPSPDGRYIVRTDWPNESGNVSIHDVDAGTDRVVTKGTPNSFGESPVFSPDGRRIMFLWYEAATDKWDLRIMNVDGSNERTYPIDGNPGSISPDNRRAAISLEVNGAAQIALLDLASGKTTPVKTVQWGRPEIGNFSPDGRFIVYSSLVGKDAVDREIFIIAVDGSSETKILGAPGNHGRPFFGPDGGHVSFPSDRSGRWDLWGIPVRNGKATENPELLKADIGRMTSLGVSNDGTLWLSQTVEQLDAWTAAIDPATWTVRGEPTRVSTKYVSSSRAPRWSPDGSKLAWVVLPEHAASYGMVNATFVVRNGANERQYAVPFHNSYNTGNYRWLPDGKGLLMIEWGQPQRRTYRRLDLETGEIRLLFDAPFGRPDSVAVSADGRAIGYSDPKSRQFIEHNLESAEEHKVAETPGVHGVSLSPDSHTLSSIAPVHEGKFMKGWSVWLTAIEDGSSREAWRPDSKWIYPGTSVWTPENRAVLVSAASGMNYFSPAQEIWYVPADSGKPHSVGLSMPSLSVTAVSPDGRSIGFTGGSVNDQVWTIANLFTARASRR